MKCGPDGCPIVAFSDLTPAEQRVERQRIAKRMADQGFTEEQIAKQLGVSKSTVSTDLLNFPETGKSKPAKTASNPKGAGRPKGKSRTPKFDKAREIVRPLMEGNKRINSRELQNAHGITHQYIEAAVLAERAVKEALAEPPIDRAELSLTAQQKLDVAIRQHKRKLDAEFEQRVLTECRERLNTISLPHYAKQMQDMVRLITSRKGVMDKTTYNKIRFCLHPDHIQDAAMKRRHEDAFTIFNSLEKLLLSEKESPTEFRKLPSTYEELMAMKAKVQAERRTKRGAKTAPDLHR